MKEVSLDIIAKENVFDLIGKQWMLITSGTSDSFNTMTASWGGLGWLWNRPVAFIFVRPERYTHEFLERNVSLTLSFYPDEHRKALQICGSLSGRDTDKVALSGLSPVSLPGGVVTFEQARLTLQCRKLFKTEMRDANFLDRSIVEKWYGEPNGFHSVYVVEIEKVFVNGDD